MTANVTANPVIALLIGLLLLLGAGIVALGLFVAWASAGRYDPTTYTRQVTLAGSSVPTGAEPLTVVSYNLGYLSGLTNNQAVTRSRDLYERHLETAIAALAPIKPDILALQEVDLEARRSLYLDQATTLADRLNYPQRAIAITWDKRYVPFPYWPPTVHFGQMLSGQVILTQFPITQHQRQVLERVSSQSFLYRAFYLERLAQVAMLTIGDRRLVVINVHLEAFDAPTRHRQTVVVRHLAETYAQRHAVILLGDFNSALNRDPEGTPRSLQHLLESPQLASAVPPDQLFSPTWWTFPADAPQYTLDYIFYTPDTLNCVHAEVLTTAAQASDHLPLMTRFCWR